MWSSWSSPSTLLREEMGEVPALEEYCRRFPHYADAIKLQLELHQAVEADREFPGTCDTTAKALFDSCEADLELGPATFPNIPGYEILGVLGAGGMGVVYRARQQGLRRQVALKMVHAGAWASPQVLARFQVEAEAVARLQHPSIVQIHEVGQHAGSPFLVLELVEGHSLAHGLDGTPWRDRQAAELVEILAHAIHSAHCQGVVHRDLTPANILLAADGTPKITDFGLAKLAIGGGDLRTQTGELLGTPSYMAPEQAASRHHAIGAATDVYALGAVLYELLTGRPPFKAEFPLETLRQVMSEEPVAPSRLRPRLPLDLETICLKCLCKEPSERYDSAAVLADDLRRFVDGRPIQARRSSPLERGWRWCRRNHLLALTSSAAVVAILSLAVYASVAAWTFRGQRDQISRQRDRADRARAEAQAVLSFFLDKVVAAAGPSDRKGGLGKDVTLRAALDAAEPQIEGSFAGQPAAEASVRVTLGKSYSYLGLPAQAIRQYGQALAVRREILGPEHPETLAVMDDLAGAYREAGRLELALPLYQKNLAHIRDRLGPAHRETLRSMDNLAALYRDLGRYADAIALHRVCSQTCEQVLGPTDPDTLDSINGLATAYLSAGRLGESIQLHEEVLERRRQSLGPDHLDTLISEFNLALAYREDGRLDDALPLCEQAAKRLASKLGADHPYALRFRAGLGEAYQEAGRLTEALSLLEEVLRTSEAQSELGPDHPDTLTSMAALADAYRASGRFDKASSLFQEAVKRQRATIGPDNPSTLESMAAFARTHFEAGSLKESLSLYEETLGRRLASLGRDHPATLGTMTDLARAYLRQRPDRALTLARDCLAILEQKRPDDWHTFDARSLLGASLLGLNKYAEAEPLLIRSYEEMKARERKIPPSSRNRFAEAGARIIELYDAWGKDDKALEWRQRIPGAAGTAKPPG
jgi:serine/threonine protein kinase/tetratricopeptide (TPR) repeat protein